VLRELEGRLEDHLHGLKRDRKPVPEAVYSRRYPERLEVRVSQSLYRRLDLQSRAEKVGLDQLVTELLTQALDRKTEAPRQQHQQQHHQRHDRNERHDRHEKGGNRHHQGGGHRHGAGRGRGYQETMDNRENFMEYVRNLEKGNFRKK